MKFTLTATASVDVAPESLPAAMQAMGTFGMAHLAWQAQQGQASRQGPPARPRSLSPGYDARDIGEDPWLPMAQPASTVARQERPALQAAAAVPPCAAPAQAEQTQLALEDAAPPGHAGAACAGWGPLHRLHAEASPSRVPPSCARRDSRRCG